MNIENELSPPLQNCYLEIRVKAHSHLQLISSNNWNKIAGRKQADVSKASPDFIDLLVTINQTF